MKPGARARRCASRYIRQWHSAGRPVPGGRRPAAPSSVCCFGPGTIADAGIFRGEPDCCVGAAPFPGRDRQFDPDRARNQRFAECRIARDRQVPCQCPQRLSKVINSTGKRKYYKDVREGDRYFECQEITLMPVVYITATSSVAFNVSSDAC